jgi:hypothetical protein
VDTAIDGARRALTGADEQLPVRVAQRFLRRPGQIAEAARELRVGRRPALASRKPAIQSRDWKTRIEVSSPMRAQRAALRV